MEDRHSQNNRKTRRILRLRWLWIVSGLGVLLALILIAIPLGMSYGIERYFIANGADHVNVGDVDFNPFTRRIVIKNLIVHVHKEKVLSISEARFSFAWFPFFNKRFILKKVELDNSILVMEELPDGRWRIGGLALTTAEDKYDARPWGFGLIAVQVHNSRVKFRSMQLTSELSIEQARLERLRSWLPDKKAHLELAGQLNDGKLQVQGDFAVFGSRTNFDGDLKLQGLSLTPFAQLIAPEPGMLQGLLDTDVRIQTQYSPEKGFSFDQTGRLTLKQARLRLDEIDLADQNFTWNGTVQMKLPDSASDFIQLTVAGQLKGSGGSVNSTPAKLTFQHRGLSWDGKFVLSQKTRMADYTLDGGLALQDFKMDASEMNLAEESLRWDGEVRLTMPDSPNALTVTATGELTEKEASLVLPAANFKLQGNGLSWNGEFGFGAGKEPAGVKLDGDLKFAKLKLVTSDALLTEEDLSWSGVFQLLLPEDNAAQRITTDGKLEARHQTITLPMQNLNLANENLAWEGRFDCGLQDFTAGLAIAGDFKLMNLTLSATYQKLRLLAAKAVNLKSVKGDINTQFNVATTKISGLALVGETDSSENASLLGASEVVVDAVRVKGFKQVSIESVRIEAARGTLHHKKNGGWRYIDDLTAYLAESGLSAEKKPSPNTAEKKKQPPEKETDIQSGIQIGNVQIVGDSVVHFIDETVSPTFRTGIRLVKARVTDVNSQKPDQASPIMLEAESRKYTRLKLQGSVQPFGKRISLDLTSKIRAVEMPPLSPYAVEMLGYNLISGEMDADIDLKITAGKMAGEGYLKLHDLFVEAVDPKKMKSEAGHPIPLESALKVLRDNDNDIHLKIPISGDVSDPQFSVSDAINQALIKGLTFGTLSYLKYALGPYGLAISIAQLGVKYGTKALTGIRLKPVEFQSGSSEPDDAALEYVEKVAKIMKEKKDMRIRLCGWATESDRAGSREALEIPPTASGEAPSEKKTASDGGGGTPAKSRSPLSDEEMLALAEQRADRIEDILVSQHGIKSERIFICKPEIDKNPAATPRVDIIF